MMQDIQHKQNIYLSLLKDKLSDDNFRYDSVTYTFYDEDNSKKPYPKLTIKQVGKNKRGYDNLSPEEKSKNCW